MKDSLHIADLIVQKLNGSISPAGEDELDRWIAASPENGEIYQRSVDPKKQLGKLEVYRMFDTEQARNRVEDKLFGSETIRLNPGKWMRIAAAILLPVVMAGAAALYFTRGSQQMELADLDAIFEPGSDKAVLILSDGSSIMLDQDEQISPIMEQGTTIEQMENTLVYSMDQAKDETVTDIAYNQLQTPRGGNYTLKLTDGTKVWLNAASSLRFPAAFSAGTREVYLEGEAYFEVTPADEPFMVHSQHIHTQVLGTSFNVSAYNEDTTVVTTLVEGRVRIVDEKISGNSLILNPNEQAIAQKSSARMEKAAVDASGFVSWVSGKLEFHNESLEEVMRKLARWYDFEYRFENEMARTFHFSARLSRDEQISTVLGMLEMTTDVEFTYKDKIILIK